MALLAVLLFLNISLLDVLDILLVAFLIYQLYHIVKGTVAIRIFTGILAIYLLWKLFEALQMELLTEILGQFIGVGVIALIIVFQQELRRFLLMVGTTGLGGNNKLLKRIFGKGRNRLSQFPLDYPELLKAVQRMAASKTGALIVVTRVSDLHLYTSGAVKLDAELTRLLIENVFYHNSPLHDGALVISNNRLVAARCVLPTSEREEFPTGLGTRHRAALGVSEISDAASIVVSEQTGGISYAKEGKLRTDLDLADLEVLLMSDFDPIN